jgi:hypothetical protein
MPGPGQYVPDATEGITRVEDLPKPQIVRRSRIYERRPCPRCGKSCRRRTYQRTLHELGDFVSGRPRDIHLTYSQHHCPSVASFSTPIWPTWQLRRLTTPTALSAWRCAWSWRTACPTAPPVGISGETIGSSSRLPPSRTGWRPGGKKALAAIEQSYLDWALEGFSGYIAADELYDGPFCVLSLVDNRTFKRIAYRVLDHDPTQDDIRQFFQDFQARLELRGLVVRGITTDGSALYPEPIQQVFGDVPHRSVHFT